VARAETATPQQYDSGSIVTRGTDSIGISVQSIGGGGGKGGKGGATAGGTNPVSNVTSLFNILAGGLNFGQTVTDLGDVLQIGQIGQEIEATFDELKGLFRSPRPTSSRISVTAQISTLRFRSVAQAALPAMAVRRTQPAPDRSRHTGPIRRHLCPKRRRRRRQRRRREFDRQGS
jgi:hypothetical protein